MNKPFFVNSNLNTSNVSIIWFATTFALVTYAAVSTRAVLSPFEVNHFMDAKRLFSIVIGAFVLWLAIRAAERSSDQGPGAQIVAVLNIAIPGAIGLLIAREGYDFATSGEFAQRAALNLRWMLTWIGYFTAAVATFLALSYYRQLQAVMSRDASVLRSNEVDYRSSVVTSDIAYETADLEFDPRIRG